MDLIYLSFWFLVVLHLDSVGSSYRFGLKISDMDFIFLVIYNNKIYIYVTKFEKLATSYLIIPFYLFSSLKLFKEIINLS